VERLMAMSGSEAAIASIANARVLLPDGRMPIATVRLASYVIDAVEVGPARAGVGEIDATGLTAIPGLIDLQTNGAFGFDCASGDPSQLTALAARLPEFGCTAFIPTVVTAPLELIEAAVGAIAAAAGQARAPGAAILGVHLEGPWIGASQAARGAHDLAHVRPFSASEWARLRSLANGLIRIVTIAPEVTGHTHAIARLAREGVVPSIGHTDATFAETQAGIDAGATLATHAYNAMRAFGHREPGTAGAVLTDDRLAAMVIPDGVHVHPAALQALVRAKGIAAVIGVTDSVWCAGLPPGDYPWGDSRVSWDGTVARRPDGRLAGSTLTMDQVLRNLMAFCNLRLPDAAKMLSANPARVLGLSDRGELEIGRRADLVLLDSSQRVAMTLIGGHVAYASSRLWAYDKVWKRR
jgi:N-acetylglucosamine-6-phosphate deacetylase